MSKLSYLARVMSGVRLKMNQMIDVVHDKCGQNKVKTFFDMCWCGARYGAGYRLCDVRVLQHERPPAGHLSHRVRNKKVIDHMNDQLLRRVRRQAAVQPAVCQVSGPQDPQRRDGHADGVYGLYRRTGGHLRQDQPRRLRPGREQAVCEGLRVPGGDAGLYPEEPAGGAGAGAAPASRHGTAPPLVGEHHAYPDGSGGRGGPCAYISVKMGRGDGYCDNSGQGGVLCRVDPERGRSSLPPPTTISTSMTAIPTPGWSSWAISCPWCRRHCSGQGGGP